MLNFENVPEKIAQWLGERVQFGMGKKAPDADTLSHFFDQYPLSSLLPYESYDPNRELFFGKQSIAFMLEVSPLTGANEKTVKIISNMLTHILPAQADLQCLLWGSPKIGGVIDRFAAERSPHGQTNSILGWLAQKRADFLKKGALTSLAKNGSFILRDFCLYLIVSMPHRHKESSADTMLALRKELLGSLASVPMASRSIPIENFLGLLYDMLNPSSSVYPTQRTWNALESLALQVTDPEYHVNVYPNRLTLASEKEAWDVRCFTVQQFPKQAMLWEGHENLGQLFNVASQIPCPFFISCHIRPMGVEKSVTKAQSAFLSKDSTARGQLGRFKPTANREQHDWQFVRDRIAAEGDQLAKVFYQVVIYAPSTEASAAEEKVKNLYTSNGWTLRKEIFVQMQSWLAMLPMMMSEGMHDDLKIFGRLRTLNTFAATNMLPLCAEWKGLRRCRLLLPGRRGQLAIWNPFDTEGGNYNCAIAAKSGSGKSVFTQDYIVGMLGAGERVWVIDVGRSYQKTCQALGGEFVEFTLESQLCLNPFTHIQHFEESLEMLKPLAAAMARPNEVTSAEEMAWLEKALCAAWEIYGNHATMSAVADWLNQQQDEIAKNLAHLLFSYTKHGMYSRYFEGPCTLNFTNHFLVLELEELKAKKDLQKIVLFTLMYQISEQMYLGSRKQAKSCVIDEAWDLLGGQNAGAASFIETGYRRARRYNANFITITQSINDYFKNATSTAAYENSEYKIILMQDNGVVSQLKHSSRLEVDDFTEKLLKSLSITSDYSECVIKSGNGVSLHRILLDPYSRILYSSKGEEFEAVKALVTQGLSIQDAVSKVAAQKFGAA